MKTITLLTDFGLRDPYVAIMKGVILSMNPVVRIIDVTHEVDPQDMREGAFLICEYYRYFERGTIHVAVVDPTVGSKRKPVAFEKDGHFFVGPDNGLFTLLIDNNTRVYGIENSKYMLREVSATFHGRDIFAPASAHLSFGVRPSAFGGPVANPVRLARILPTVRKDAIRGQVVRFDRFGNAITNITMNVVREFAQERPFTITLAGMSFTSINRSYFEQDFTCVEGSSGYLEFGYFRGSLREVKGVAKGDPVTVKLD
ncbi:SAM hydrolase/SAM-dependent halogenase family protein [Syntrophorhabdus aromaticivorans]|uniref:SAM-dependent chlorinase/fluorinase n=1 Tax=Syntrophorhabdus aromaticivorans TaxID=328301 RepID=A0A971M309_9BACT|nr:SAM-dependent chlorinase/fluorinase [Syntrophorhabdus aromaticivorans]NLW34581.1 SAM-dependent chlorinase/fluorinase [Syntrophorhabdus aromaticivorans]